MNPVWTLALLAAGIGLGAPAAAQTCPAGSQRVLAPGALLRGNTVCAVRGGDKWQEFHSGSGAGSPLIDYKRGPSDPVDPSATVGSWSFAGGAGSTVTYNYGSGGSYTYAVCRVGGGSTYTFVPTSGNSVTGVTVLPGQVACP